MPVNLFDLPAEIRDEIWFHLIDSNSTVEMQLARADNGLYSYCVALPWAGILGANHRCHYELSEKLQGKGGQRRPVRVAIHFMDLFTIDQFTSTPMEELAKSAFREKWVNSLVVETDSNIRCPSSADSEEALMTLHRNQVVYCSERMNKMANAMVGVSTRTDIQMDEKETSLNRFMRLNVFFD